jgi:hypothetical protein
MTQTRHLAADSRRRCSPPTERVFAVEAMRRLPACRQVAMRFCGLDSLRTGLIVRGVAARGRGMRTQDALADRTDLNTLHLALASSQGPVGVLRPVIAA